MKVIIQVFKKHQSLLKFLFMVAVFIVVANELLSIAKTISLNQLETIFSELAWWKIAAMVIIGLIAILPMLGYDVLLNKLLGLTQSKSYLFETSWLINTINNIAGFGGLISVGLRVEFYGKKQQGKEITAALAKIMLFSLAGLSIYCILSFVGTQGILENGYLQQYWIWLLGGGLYFPLLYAVTTMKKKGYLGGLKSKQRLFLAATSFLEWTGVIFTFLSIGWLLGLSFYSWEVISLFTAAMVVGIVSMIPGAIGSFDLIMLLGLTALGIDRERIALWLLLFRLCYYVIPVLIGLIFFFKHGFLKFDEKYDGVPKQLLTEIAHKIHVSLLYISGFLMVLSATIPEWFTSIHWMRDLFPLQFRLIFQLPSIILGFGILIMGRGMAARVKRAYLPTLVLLIATIGYTTLTGFPVIAPLFFAFVFILVFLSKSELYRKQLVYAWEWMIKDGLVFGTLVLSYLIIGVYQLPVLKHHRPPKHLMSFFILPSEKFWLRGFIGIAIAMIFILLVLSYLQGAKKQVGQALDEARLKHILTSFGGNSDSELVFTGDKDVYIYNDGNEDTVYLQYRTLNNKCVVMGDPSGKKSDFATAIEAFIEETDQWCYQPVFYEAQEETVMLLHEFGYDFIKMGENALVDLNTFTTSGKKMRGTRAAIHKVSRLGYCFEILQPPFSSQTRTELKTVSDRWLDQRNERGFSMGFFSAAYLARNPLAVVKNKEGQIVSFANILPAYTKDSGTVDLMRHDPQNAPSGSMDFLFVHLFEWMKEQGIHKFDLGMAPFSNVGQSRKSFVQERLASLLYAFGNRVYSFNGLRSYKEKYATQWLPRYTLYSRDSWIICVVAALLIVDNRPIDPNEI